MISKFKVKHLDCASCALTMEGICEDTKGVKKAEVHTISRTLTVEHDDSVKPEKIKSALAQEGYPVETI
jgi:cation transport ATPase